MAIRKKNHKIILFFLAYKHRMPDDFYDTYTWDNGGVGGWFTPNKDYAEAYEAWKAEKAATEPQHSGQDGLRFSTVNVDENSTLEETNENFNNELDSYGSGVLPSNVFLSIGYPKGILSKGIPSKPIVLRQKVLTKALKKHGLEVSDVRNLPSALASPIFIFKSSPSSISVLTELQSKDGKNVFVAIEIDATKQFGHEFLEVNDVLTIHGREEENIIKPIIENDSLVWVDKEKGQNWLSSAKSNSQAITNDDLDNAAKIIQDFDNSKFEKENAENNAKTNEKGGVVFSTVDMSNYEVIKEAREMVSGKKQPFNGYVSSEYYRGETEDGEPYVIRVSDHPAKKDNFDLYEDNEGKVLSLVFTDDLEGDFEEWKKHEYGHEAFEALTIQEKAEYGLAALKWLKGKGAVDEDDLSHYSKDFLPNEGAARLIAYVYDNYGANNIMNGTFVGNEKIAKLAAAIQNYFKNGEEGSKDGNPLGRGLRSGREENNPRDGLLQKSGRGQEARNNQGDEGGTVAEGDSGLRFSTVEDEEAEEGYDAGSATFEESVTGGLLKAASRTSAALSARVTAMRALGGN